MLSNKVIWISGGSTGIGKSTAIKFVEKNWIVVVTARNKDNLQKLKEEINNKFKMNKFYIFTCDNTIKEQVKKTVDKIEGEVGPIELVLLNAGTTHPYSNEFNLDYYNHVVKTNITGTLNCIDSIYPKFKSRKSGHISIVSSMVGFRGLPTASAYTMSKAALINLAESLYFDFKKIGVRVSLVNPGFIQTPLTDKNQFPMPFIKSPEYAANKIYDGLIHSNKFELIFPKQWFFIMKTLRLLPYWIYFYLISKVTRL